MRFFSGVALILIGASAVLTPAAEAQLTGAVIQVDRSAGLRSIPRTIFGTNLEWIWNENLLWNPSTNAPDPAYVPLVKSFNSPLYRFPGGTFADYYNWRNGVGPAAARPATLSMPGGAVSANVFGTDEALKVASLTNGELMITVNAVTGTPQDAAAWVKYINTSGRGHATYWEVGNEMYMGANTPGSTAASTYASRFLAFAAAMKAADPTIKVGAILDEYLGSTTSSPWTQTVLTTAGSAIDFVAVHNAYAPMLFTVPSTTAESVYDSMLAAPVVIEKSLQSLAARVDALVPARAGKIGIAVTEWGPYFQTDLNAPYTDHVKTLGSALYTAGTLMAFMRSPRTIVANHFKLNDFLYMGAIGIRNGVATPTASHYAFQLFTGHAGTELVNCTVTSPTHFTLGAGVVAGMSQVSDLDAVATTNAAGTHLYVTVVNRNRSNYVDAALKVKNATVVSGTAWTLAGKALDANTGTALPQIPGVKWAAPAHLSVNSRIDQGGPAEVTLQSAAIPGAAANMTYRFPAASVVSLDFQVR